MCEIKFTMEKETKNTVRFTEVLEGKLTNPAIGTIYIPKETLKTMGWKDGDDISIDISNAGKPSTTKGHKTAAEKAKEAPAKKATKAGKTTATKAAKAAPKKTAKKTAKKS